MHLIEFLVKLYLKGYFSFTLIVKARMLKVKIADLGVSNEFDGPDAFLTNTAGTPAFTGLGVMRRNMYL